MEKLLAISSDGLAEYRGICQGGSFRNERQEELERLLERKNGFYAFESALHVFPSCSGSSLMSLERWNARETWRDAYGTMTDGCLFFAEDVFGGQFCIRDDRVWSFDPETGRARALSDTLVEWCEMILDDSEYLTGFPLAHAWQERNGPLSPGFRLLPKMPFILGGEYDVRNLHALEAVAGMRLRGDIAQQVRDLPEGAPVRLRVEYGRQE